MSEREKYKRLTDMIARISGFVLTFEEAIGSIRVNERELRSIDLEIEADKIARTEYNCRKIIEKLNKIKFGLEEIASGR